MNRISVNGIGANGNFPADGFQTSQGNAYLLLITGNDSFDGTVTPQHSIDGETWETSYFQEINSTSGLLTSGVASPSTVKEYIVYPPSAQVRVNVASWTTGSLDIVLKETNWPGPALQASQLYVDATKVGGDGSGLYVQGPAASDAALAGNPLLLGGSVDDTGPTSAGEGDVRTLRSTPEGNLIVEIYKDNISVANASPNALRLHGPTASGEAQSGNPVLIGGNIDDTSPAAEAEGDMKFFRSTPEGNQIAEIYVDNVTVGKIDDAAFTPATDAVLPWGALADEASPDSVDEGDIGVLAMTTARELYVRPSRRGASEVISEYDARGAATTAYAIATPNSGKKIRLISVTIHFDNATAIKHEVYFHTGGGISSDVTKAVFSVWMDLVDHPTFSQSWPDGAGPVGATDDVISYRQSGTSGNCVITVLFREED